jgi:hypothetical protein
VLKGIQNARVLLENIFDIMKQKKHVCVYLTTYKQYACPLIQQFHFYKVTLENKICKNIYILTFFLCSECTENSVLCTENIANAY